MLFGSHVFMAHEAAQSANRSLMYRPVSQDVCVLAVVASEKGVVVGRLAYREDGDLIDCQRMGVGGKAIPPNVDKVATLALILSEICRSLASSL